MVVLKGIENRIEFQESPRKVFRHLANPQNIPLFVPGIRNATVTNWVPDGVGTRVSLTTRHAHHRDAELAEESERRFIAYRDDHGTLNEWELRRAPAGGTLATNRIIGSFADGEAERLSEEARGKIFAFRDIVDGAVMKRG